MTTSFVPIIDFDNCGLNADNDTYERTAESIGDLLYNALHGCGFAYLSNSGITDKEVNAVNDITAKFFQAPLEKKNEFARRPDNYGYVGLCTEQLNPAQPFDYKEAFNVNGTSLDNPDTNWPNNLSPEFQNTMKYFMEKCRLLTLRILKTLGIGMKLADSDHFVKCHSFINQIKGNSTALRSLYYPPLPEAEAKQPNYVRLGEHSDYGSLTLLFQDKIGGLQVQNLDGEFVDALPIDETVLINIGDLLQFWSQNRLKSTKHRVVNSQDPEKQKQIRRSMAYFVHPDDEVLVDQELVFQNETSQHKEEKEIKSGLTAYGYLMKKFEETY